METSHRLSHVGARINKWGAAGVVFCAASYAVPPHYPFCILLLILEISGLGCSIVAAIRGSKNWLILSAIASLLTAQTVLFVLVDC
jgi:hypothetical protein